MSGKTTPDVEQISVFATPEAIGSSGVNIKEAAELYGNVEAARSYRYVARRYVDVDGL